MARGNRRENRAAAKALLEMPQAEKDALKAAQQEQLDFFEEANNNVDSEDDDLLDNANEEDSEVEAGDKKTAAPNVQSENLGDEEEVGEGEVDGGNEVDEDIVDGADKAAAKATPETKTADTTDASKTDATKTAEPAPKEGEKKAEEVKTEEKKPVSETPGTLSNEEAAQLYTEWRDQTEDLLANHHYRLNEDQVNELNENPAAVIPKLMSKVYMDSISAAFQQFVTYLPRMVGQVIEQRNTMNAAEQKFFEKWPALADKRDTVLRLGQAYRQSNPAASMEDFINEVGAQAMVALRLSPTNGNGNATEKPASNKQPSSFKPATSTPAPRTAPSTPTNPFDALVSEFDFSEEDIDEN